MKRLDKFKKISMKVKMRVISDNWEKISDQHKQKYINLADLDRVRYQNEQNMLLEKGYFIDKNGISSLDPAMAAERSSSSEPVEIDHSK